MFSYGLNMYKKPDSVILTRTLNYLSVSFEEHTTCFFINLLTISHQTTAVEVVKKKEITYIFIFYRTKSDRKISKEHLFLEVIQRRGQDHYLKL